MDEMFLSASLAFVVGLTLGMIFGAEGGVKAGLEIACESVDMSVVRIDDDYRCVSLEDLR